MTPERDPKKIVGRVLHVDLDNNEFIVELPNGFVIPYDILEDDDFAKGDVVLVSADLTKVRPAPRHLWREEQWIGIVRLVLKKEVIVDVGGRIRAFPSPKGFKLKKGNTVEGADSAGIQRVLTKEPIRYLDLREDPVSAKEFRTKPSDYPSFDDFGGFSEIVERAQELIELPLRKHSELAKIGARPIKGVLFTGPPGTGKTMLARIIANRAGATFYQVSGPQVLSQWYGQSEELIRAIFDDAAEQDRAIVFFDEMDSLATQRNDNSHEASRRIVGQLLASIDGFSIDTNVVVVATTNRPQDIDVALRRPGRFDWEIHFSLPPLEDREVVLRTSARKLNIRGEMPHSIIAQKTESWSPAELAAIWSEAALLAVKDERDVIVEEDYFGGFERVASQRARVVASSREEHAEETQ
ncbi:ATP-binding protein [Micromonospora sp. WMMD975]|uniref:ATP-binding protein n=1 Tax=Micromonospora sp. WMMD975 TaxID=3016087 RepID=UPI00249B0571|nr:ATP-binding protein [Micromonospora sp. WMMD975]WFE34554.1 ATP-binding protein [Micromonospora sp. WMMD975]